ncbi:MAG: hypothetical protein HZB83_08590 [Deltaproteobacteria bacterium]|nr:hypothetical protein [Deltaproteobacteria bacterium]
MKNPIERFFEEWHLKSKMYSEFTKIRVKFDKQVHSLSKEFKREVASLEKKGRKLKIEEKLKIWKKDYDAVMKDLRKKAERTMVKVRNDYKLAIDKLKARL